MLCSPCLDFGKALVKKFIYLFFYKDKIFMQSTKYKCGYAYSTKK